MGKATQLIVRTVLTLKKHLSPGIIKRGESEGSAPRFLNLAVDVCEWFPFHPDRHTPGETAHRCPLKG